MTVSRSTSNLPSVFFTHHCALMMMQITWNVGTQNVLTPSCTDDEAYCLFSHLWHNLKVCEDDHQTSLEGECPLFLYSECLYHHQTMLAVHAVRRSMTICWNSSLTNPIVAVAAHHQAMMGYHARSNTSLLRCNDEWDVRRSCPQNRSVLDGHARHSYQVATTFFQYESKWRWLPALRKIRARPNIE